MLLVTVLTVTLWQSQLGVVLAENDFGFSEAAAAPDDFETELLEDAVIENSSRGIEGGPLVAYVGRVFHWTVRGDEEAPGGYQVKTEHGKGLPSWLLFEKKDAIFWGVPLAHDVGTINLTVKSVGGHSKPTEMTINVLSSNEEAEGIEKCPKHEDITVLTLTLDKNIRAIKPRQRVIAINNIAKFFGLPYSAFKLKPQLEQEDLKDSSIVLAGPGNLRSRNSKVISLLQVPVGCDGRLWISTVSLVHQLKQQARDGTIAEVLRLPLIGWRVKTEAKKAEREKRQAPDDNDFGSGDYNDEDEYYDDYEDYDGDLSSNAKDSVTPAIQKSPITTTTRTTTTTTPDPDIDDYEIYDDLDIDSDINAPEIPITPPTQKTTLTEATSTTSSTSTTTTTTVVPETSTHPHRHHHGELNPGITLPKEPLVTTQKAAQLDKIPITAPTTTVKTPTIQFGNKPKSPNPDSVLNFDDNYAYGEYDDEDDEDDIGPDESVTIMPNIHRFNDNNDIIPMETTTEVIKTTVKETTVRAVIPTTTPTTTSTTTTTVAPTVTTIGSTTSTTTVATTASTTTTELSTTFDVVEETMPEFYYTPTDNDNSLGGVEETTTQTPKPVSALTSAATTWTTPTTSTQAVIINTSTFVTESSAPITEQDTTVKVTTLRHIPTTTPPGTTVPIGEVTEIEYQKNFEPFIENRLKQMSVTAGKIFRFVVPYNTFKDFEDEYNLTYELLDSNNRTVRNNTWLHFNPIRREVYGLPLEEEVSKWIFWVRASDREGASVQEKLNIQVQQHKLDLVVNHEFSLHIRIEKQQEFTHYVDWSLKVLRALGKIYNTNMSEITVRKINYTHEPVVFTWSNDSVPTSYCPETEIEELYKILTANDRGDPSRELNVALAPELRVKKVLYQELGVCEQPQTPVTPPVNFSPILRNPIDKVNATVGELLIFKVKDDVFYDPEDQDPNRLNITLVTENRAPLPVNSWLQFDSKNKEFYGIPRKSGRSEYQLVCIDSGGLLGADSLEVIVYPPSKRNYNVEFSMNITDIPYQTFINSAAVQKKFVEKLMLLFGENTPSNFHFALPFKQTYDSVIITWYNKSLPTHRCPNEEINRLESVLHNMNDKSISHKVHNIMEPEFRVSTIKVHPIGNCKPKTTHEYYPEVIKPVEESTPQPRGDEYLITFILPAVIIALMLFLAAVAAIVLYRRRRMGKMTVEEDGRQSYGNKGIPVIFQEELEEKPEPGTKTPIILKDEKPPLAPPEYSKSGSVKLTDDDSEPYQPPPPFTRTHQDNGRQPRPKPTPTYRKPPPYVPP